MTPGVFVQQIDWNGLSIEVSYEPDWLQNPGRAHLQLRSVAPERAPLPMSETGYRSHFCFTEDIVAEGGPIAYTVAWLDHAAEAPAWKAQQQKARQFTLF